uniref:Uncharacterized protein n=1 Tax=Parascaris univalens TaxID=6257 RepID=A0A914ZXN1_PARUN
MEITGIQKNPEHSAARFPGSPAQLVKSGRTATLACLPVLHYGRDCKEVHVPCVALLNVYDIFVIMSRLNIVDPTLVVAAGSVERRTEENVRHLLPNVPAVRRAASAVEL